MRRSVLILFVVGLWRLCTGYYRFERHAVGRRFVMEDGRTFRVFRRVERRAKNLSRASVAFVVRFRPVHMTVEQNIRFSHLPMIVMLGFPGFRSKYWTVEDATGLCQGIYEWESRTQADAYAASVAMRFMSARSQPGSVTYTIVDQSSEPYWACHDAK